MKKKTKEDALVEHLKALGLDDFMNELDLGSSRYDLIKDEKRKRNRKLTKQELKDQEEAVSFQNALEKL